MLYGKRFTKRKSRKYAIKKVPATPTYTNVVAGCAIIFADNANTYYDLTDTLVTNSSDWTTLKNNYSSFKVVKVTIDYSPGCVAPIQLTDSANGWVCIRDGYGVTPLATMSSNELAKFPNCIAFNNCRPFSLSRKVISGDWFHGNSTSSLLSEMPKLVLYLSLYNVATTNVTRGSLKIRYFMLARGSQIEG